MNEHLTDTLLYWTKKETQSWDQTSGKNKAFYSKALKEKPLLFIISLFNSNLYGSQNGSQNIWTRSKWRIPKTIEKFEQKVIRIINSLP